jgi:hypothetical protein
MIGEPSYTLYCDEAGSTGIDLTGADQPFFIAAGYIVPDEKADRLRTMLDDGRASISRERGSDLSELKASSLVNSAKGRHNVARILRDLESNGAHPLLVALDKRFSLGGRFIDEFLDFGDNPRAGPEFCTDRDIKRASATFIGESAVATLKAIEESLREPSRQNREAAVRAVVNDLRGRGIDGLAYIAEGALLNDQLLATPEESEFGFPTFSMGHTPNPTSLNLLLAAAETFSRLNNISHVRLMHDDTAHMEAALKHVYWLASDPEAYERLSDPYIERPPRVERVSAPEFVRSEDEPLIQASDLLAGGTAYWLKRGIRGEHLDRSAKEIAETTITVFMDGYVPAAGAVLSDNVEWLSTLSRTLDWNKVRRPKRTGSAT